VAGVIMPRSTDESQDDSDNDEPATYTSSLTAEKSDRSQRVDEVDSGNKMAGAAGIVVAAEKDVAHAESDANEHLGSRSDASESERTPGAGYHNIATLGDDVNLLDYVREHNTTLTFPEKVSRRLPANHTSTVEHGARWDRC
jgi:hypothetical protein